MTHLSLFTGIGGLDLAAEWAGFRTVGQCEWADYPTKVLEKHWPNVPRWRDVRELTAKSFRERTGLESVTIISGGFPCQPFSVAGKQKGKEDDRYLWPEMLRVIRELTPRWVVGENVPGILRIAADDVCNDLEREGYDVGIFNFEAAAVGAPHRRDRFFFVANSRGRGRCWPRGIQGPRENQETMGKASSASMPASEAVANTTQGNGSRVLRIESEGPENRQTGMPARGCGRSGRKNAADSNSEPVGWPTIARNQRGQWSAEPDVGRVAHGVSFRVDRLKCLGNAVVPQQAYPIFKAIAEVEGVYANR